MTMLASTAMDVDPRGTLYVSQYERPAEYLRFRESTPGFEMLLTTNLAGPSAIALQDGRVLLPSLSPSPRVLALSTGKAPAALIESDEPTYGPLTAVGRDRVALLMGDPNDFAVMAIETGRLIKRFKAPPDVTSLGASPDGLTLYYASRGSIAAVSVDGGPARTLASGDSLVVDPDSGDLIVKTVGPGGFRLVRLKPSGGTPQPIEMKGPYRLTGDALVAGALRNGRLLVAIASTDSWYWFVGVLDLKTSRLDKVAVNYFTDFHGATWTPDGRILGTGVGARSALWKFTPVRKN